MRQTQRSSNHLAKQQCHKLRTLRFVNRSSLTACIRSGLVDPDSTASSFAPPFSLRPPRDTPAAAAQEHQSLRVSCGSQTPACGETENDGRGRGGGGVFGFVSASQKRFPCQSELGKALTTITYRNKRYPQKFTGNSQRRYRIQARGGHKIHATIRKLRR